MTDKVSARIGKLMPATPGGTRNIKTSVVEEIRKQAVELEQQALDARLAAVEARADVAESRGQQRAALTVTEPLTYGPQSPHSWFADTYRAFRGDRGEARQRLDRHTEEMGKILPARRAAREREAELRAERALSGTAAERRALDEFRRGGRPVFERRTVTRIDGPTGMGNFVPPAWLIDRTIPPARADAALAAAASTLPLPELCDSVNIPAIRTGTAAGVQPGDATSPSSRDLADSFVSSPVITVAGTVDVAAQWLDQGSGNVGGALDSLIWDDLDADLQLTVDGLLILGSGTNGQTAGLFPPQTTVGTSLAVYAPNGNTGASQQWYYNGGTGTTLGTTVAQCISGVTRARGKRPTHLLTAPWVWDLLTSQTDQQDRPYVEPKGPHPVPPGAEPPPGVIGHAHGLPLLGDLNMPTTFGGTNSPPQTPYLGGLNGAQYAGQPGTGASALYTPVVPIIPADMFVFLGQPRMELMDEALDGTLAYRFQLRRYAAILVNRYQALGSGTLPNSGGWAKGANSSYGVVTQQGSNSLLAIGSQGF